MKWLDKLKEYAPDIASAVMTGGATLPGLAYKAISDAVGANISTSEDIAGYVNQADPEDMLKIKQANNAFKIRMRELDNELLASELSDKQDARRNHKHSPMPAIVTGAMTCIVAGLFYALFAGAVPPDNKEVLYMLTGQASALWGACITYWVGTTRSSAEKDRNRKAP